MRRRIIMPRVCASPSCTVIFTPSRSVIRFCSNRCWHRARYALFVENISTYLSERIARCQHDDCPYCCWPWIGPINKMGYGIAYAGREGNSLAHRIVYQRANRLILQPDMHVCHHCDNPPCCNLWHLFPGTRQDNTADMVRKKRHHHGETHRFAKLTTGQVQQIRVLYTQGLYHRVIAEQFGVSRRTIGKICQGTSRQLG